MFLAPSRAADSGPGRYPGARLRSGEIRLIELLPGTWEDPIRCRLFNATQTTARYQALSYVWGSTRKTRSIAINSLPYPTTVNLESALRHLREHNKLGLTLWVDALCINQDDLEERTQQVRLMGSIYQSCEKGIVYLGSDLNDASTRPSTSVVDFNQMEHRILDEALPTGEEISKQIFNVFRVFSFIKSSSANKCLYDTLGFWPGAPCTDNETSGQIPRKGIAHLVETLRRFMHPPCTPWWNRIWVIQEIAAPPRVEVAYGLFSISWEMLSYAALYCSRHSMACCSKFAALLPQDQIKVLDDFSQRIADINELRVGGAEDSRPLLDLLCKFRDRKASDPRDKVFALLSLVKEDHNRKCKSQSTNRPIDCPRPEPIVPNYSQEVVDVYCEATLYCIYMSGLSFFSTDLSRKFRDDLPSWVPDWSAPGSQTYSIRTKSVELYNACPTQSPLEKVVRPLGARRISIIASPLDMVQQVGEVMWGDDARFCRETLTKWWRMVHSFLNSGGDSINGTMRRDIVGFENFWTFFCADLINDPKGTSSVRRASPQDEGYFLEWAQKSHRSPFNHVHAWDEDYVWSLAGQAHRNIQLLWPELTPFDGPAFDSFRCGNIHGPTGLETGYFTAEYQAYVRECRERRVSSLLRFAEDDNLVRCHFLDNNSDFKQDGPWIILAHTSERELVKSDIFTVDLTTREKVTIVDESIMAATLSRRLLIGNNFVGLGPAETKLGDELYLLEGGRTPFVLRKRHSPSEDSYEIVGECYVHGMMDPSPFKAAAGHRWISIV